MRLKVGFFLLIVTGLVYARIENVIVKGEDNNTVIEIKVPEDIPYAILKMKDANAIIVDLHTGEVDFAPGEYTVEKGGVNKIVIETFQKTSLTRLFVYFDNDYNYWDERGADYIKIALLETGGTEEAFSIKEMEPQFVTEVVEEPEVEFPEAPAVTSSPREGIRISLNLENADIVTVINGIAEYVGLNVLYSTEIEGKVTVILRGVPWRRALELILKTVGLSYIEEEGIIRIAPPEKLKKEEIERRKAEEEVKLLKPLLTRIYKLEFTTPEEVIPTISNLLTKRGRIEKHVHTNALIVTDIRDVHDKVAGIIKDLDVKTPQVAIEAKIVEINTRALQEIGIKWGARFVGPVGTEPGQVGYGARTPVEDPSLPETPYAEGGGELPGTPSLQFTIGYLSPQIDLYGILGALESKELIRTISSPKIVVSDNKKAKILGGLKIPYTFLDQRGNPVTQLVDVGIKLEVVPYVNSLNQVTLDLKTEVSEAGEPTVAGLTILVNEAETRVLLSDGETAVIGGLVKAKVSKAKSGIPFLHRIPVLGLLFGGKGQTEEEREIVIFITPHIIAE